MIDYNVLEFDPTGVSPDNKISISFSITPPASPGSFYFTIPGRSPYFTKDLVVNYTSRDGLEQRELIFGQDFLWTHKFIEASKATLKDVWAGISFINRTLDGVVEMSPQWLGGEDWIVDESKVAQIILQTISNPRTTTWDEVATPPRKFPVISHEWDVVNMVGMQEVVAAIISIGQLLADRNADESGNGVGGTHILNLENPHQTTKEHVQLGLVPNMGLASLVNAKTGGIDNNIGFMTPYLTLESIKHNTPNIIEAALDEFKNALSAADFNLSNVDNYATTTDVDSNEVDKIATAALVNQKITTALTSVIGAIDTLNSRNLADLGGMSATEIDGLFEGVDLSIDAINTRVNNIEMWDTSTFGLEWLDGYSISTVEDVNTGAANKLVDAVTLQAVLTAAVAGGFADSDYATSAALTAHIDNSGNVHNLTAEDIDVYVKAETEAVIASAIEESELTLNTAISTKADQETLDLNIDTISTTLVTNFNEITWYLDGKSIFKPELISGHPDRMLDTVMDVSLSSTGIFVLYAASDDTRYLYMYRDDTWTLIDLPVATGLIVTLDVSDSVIVVTTDTSEVFKTNDSGVTWSVAQTLSGNVVHLDNYTDRWIFATTTDVYISVDGMDNLSIATATDMTNIKSVEITDTIIVLLSDTEIKVSSDDGLTWTPTTVGLDTPYRDLAMYGADTIMAINEVGEISVLKNTVGTWTVLPGVDVAADIHTNHQGLFLAVSADNVFKSYDKGDNWVEVFAGDVDITGVKTSTYGWILHTNNNGLYYSR